MRIIPLIINWNIKENSFLSPYIEKALPYSIHFPVWYLKELNFRETDEEKQRKPS